jgi:hypothetical protein
MKPKHMLTNHEHTLADLAPSPDYTFQVLRYDSARQSHDPTT